VLIGLHNKILESRTNSADAGINSPAYTYQVSLKSSSRMP